MRPRPVTRRQREGGFALLVVFLLAAAVAFSLYQELPRAAFESARDKEQILIDRGNQYKRAIEVYYAVNKRYPAELKDLENTNDKRYLRRRYKDPMTGADEWRLIHTNGSALTDSLVVKPPAQNAANGTPASGSNVGGGPLGANNLNTAPATTDPAATTNADGTPVVPAVNAAVSRRPSDRGFNAGALAQLGQPGGGPQSPNPFGGAAGGANPPGYDPNDPRTWPAITLVAPTATGGQPNQNGLPGQVPNTQIVPGAVPSNIPGQAPGLGGANPQAPTFDPLNPTGPSSANPLGAANQTPAQQPPNGFSPLFNQQPPVNQQPGFNQQPPNQQPTFNQQPPVNQQPSQPGLPGFPGPSNATPFAGAAQPGAQTVPGGANAATQFINNQLFSPAQNGTAPAAPGANPASGGPGIAGVASKYKGPSIKSYKKRTLYQEWEFIFEPSAQTTATPGASPGLANPNQGQPGQNQPGQNQPGQNQPGQAQPGQNQPGQNPFPNLFGPSTGQTPTPSMTPNTGASFPGPTTPPAN